MSPEMLIPAADSIPVPWGWFEALLLVTFTCHLLFMNVLLGGGLLALIGRRKSPVLSAQLGTRLPTTLALTVNLGVPPLLFLQVLYGQFLYTSAVLSAVYWMLLVALVMGAYALLYVQAGRLKRSQAGFAPLLLAVGGLLAVSFILSNIMTLMLRPEAWTAYFSNPRGTVLNLDDPTLFPRWLHFVLASVAVAGLFSALCNFRKAEKGDRDAAGRTRMGMKWFSSVSLVQIAVGLWWLLTLPRPVMLRFMGESMWPTMLFVAALAAVGVVLAFGFMGRVVATAGALVGTVLLMAGMRDVVRMASVEQYFHPEDMPVTGQYGSMVLFGVSFAVGIAALVYMIIVHRRAGGGL